MLGAERPFESSAEAYRAIFERAEVKRDLQAIGIKTPEALWARQLASQATAFAIPGGGPLQSDVFPILEYEAPKAFYLGGWSALLVLFDERTWQHELAPDAKAKALATLDVAGLRDVFGRFISVNAQLNGYVEARINAADKRRKFDGAGIPCVFDRPDFAADKAHVPQGASEEWTQLLEAEAAIRTNSKSLNEPVATIQAVLTSGRLNASATVAGRSQTDLAANAAKACLRRGDGERARALVLAGLKIDPTCAELLYLARILDRTRSTTSPNRR
jgi:hypothetical protein